MISWSKLINICKKVYPAEHELKKTVGIDNVESPPRKTLIFKKEQETGQGINKYF